MPHGPIPDKPVAQTAQEAVDSQKRWLQIAAVEPDADRRRDALATADAESRRALRLTFEQERLRLITSRPLPPTQ